MLDKKIKKMLDDQINMELYSAYLYHQMQYRFEEMNLKGFAHWYEVQTREEISHAARIEDYLQDISEKICFMDLPATKDLPCDVKKLLELALSHEQKITESIHKIYAEAESLKDYQTMVFLNWFIMEQIEEEVNAKDNLARYELVSENSCSMLEIDKCFGDRR